MQCEKSHLSLITNKSIQRKQRQSSPVIKYGHQDDD